MGVAVYPGEYSGSNGFTSNVNASTVLLEGAKYVCEEAVKTLESCMSDGAKEYPDARLNATSATSETDTYRTQYNIFGDPPTEHLIHSTWSKEDGPCGFVQQNLKVAAHGVARCVIDKSAHLTGCTSPDEGSLGGSGSGSLGDDIERIRDVVSGTISEASKDEEGMHPLIPVAIAVGTDVLLFNGRGLKTVKATVVGTATGARNLWRDPGQTCSNLARGVCAVLGDPNRYLCAAVTTTATTLVNDVQNSPIGKAVHAGGRRIAHACGYGRNAVIPTGTDGDVVDPPAVVDISERNAQQPPPVPTRPASHAARVAPTGSTGIIPAPAVPTR
jgi:hypothetical protein